MYFGTPLQWSSPNAAAYMKAPVRICRLRLLIFFFFLAPGARSDSCEKAEEQLHPSSEHPPLWHSSPALLPLVHSPASPHDLCGCWAEQVFLSLFLFNSEPVMYTSSK